MNSVGSLANKNILLLQGPMGDFFKQLDKHFRSKKAQTFRIGFNGGDWLFSYKDNYTPYKDTPQNWPEFIRNFLQKNQIDKVFLFGDCRLYQSITIKEAQKLGVEVFVFEEGYVRPDFVTLEKWGVNNFSLIPRESEFYKSLDKKDLKLKDTIPTNPSFFKMAWSATWYYIFLYVGEFFYPHYQHHRETNPWVEAFYGIRNFFRKYKYKFIEKGKLQEVTKLEYFFVPLQTYNDFQLRVHSNFETIEDFIQEVITSFAKSDKTDRFLVFKHHPMDRGRKDYKNVILKTAKKYNLEKQMIVIYDLHLPTLLDHTLGTITINSTVGLQALYHNSPVKVLGTAIYDIKGLTNQQSLDNFWSNPIKPDMNLFYKFRSYLIQKTQINGSFYGYFDFESI